VCPYITLLSNGLTRVAELGQESRAPIEEVKAFQLLLSDQYWIINPLISGLEIKVKAQTQQIWEEVLHVTTLKVSARQTHLAG